MAEPRVVRQEELKHPGLQAVCGRVEIHVCLAELNRLKVYFRQRGRATRIMFSNSEELLIRLPNNAGEVLYYGPMKGVDHV